MNLIKTLKTCYYLFQTPPSGLLQMYNPGWFIAFVPLKIVVAAPLVILVFVWPFAIFGIWMDALFAPFRKKNFVEDFPPMDTETVSLQVWSCGRYCNGVGVPHHQHRHLQITCCSARDKILIWHPLLEVGASVVADTLPEDHPQRPCVQTCWWMTSSCFRISPFI